MTVTQSFIGQSILLLAPTEYQFAPLISFLSLVFVPKPW